MTGSQEALDPRSVCLGLLGVSFASLLAEKELEKQIDPQIAAFGETYATEVSCAAMALDRVKFDELGRLDVRPPFGETNEIGWRARLRG